MGRGRWIVATAVAVLGLGVGVPAVSATQGGGPAATGLVEVQETWASGRVVDAETGLPIRNAFVHYVPQGFDEAEARGRTDADGLYSITGLQHEEYGIWVRAPRHMPGWVGCSFELYPTFGEACTHATGELPGDIRMVRR